MAAAAKAAAAAADAKGDGTQSKSRERKGPNIKGREFPGLPHLAELTQKTPSMYDDAGRKYYLYTEKTFPVLWQERGGNVAFNSDEVVFVVLLPLGITRQFPGFDFPDDPIGATVSLQDEKKIFTGTVNFTMFPPVGHATGFLHLTNLKAVDKYPPPPQQRQPVVVVAAAPAATAAPAGARR